MMSNGSFWAALYAGITTHYYLFINLILIHGFYLLSENSEIYVVIKEEKEFASKNIGCKGVL